MMNPLMLKSKLFIFYNCGWLIYSLSPRFLELTVINLSLLIVVKGHRIPAVV